MKLIDTFLIVLFGVVMAIALIVSQPAVSSIVIGITIWLIVLMQRESRRRERELKQQGFHVEYVCAGALKVGPNDFAVVYYGREGNIWFYGTRSPDGKDILNIPSPDEWREKVPEWTQTQRQTVVERILQARPRIVIQ